MDKIKVSYKIYVRHVSWSGKITGGGEGVIHHYIHGIDGHTYAIVLNSDNQLIMARLDMIKVLEVNGVAV